MAEADQLQREVVAAQNRDGGWGYQGVSSWTEPTAFAMMALMAHGQTGSAYDRGRQWLINRQRLDGGWAPHSLVETSTWVTSLAVMALRQEDVDATVCARGVNWVVDQIKPAISAGERMAYYLRGVEPPLQPEGGCSWYPGTAAWIAPTVMSALALSNAVQFQDKKDRLGRLILECRNYILARRCRDGGWNHGGARYRSENANSYPEMTGMALLALTGVQNSELAIPLDRSQAFLRSSNSSEASSWLALGLAKHGRSVPARGVFPECRIMREKCLRLLVLAEPSRNRLMTRT